jgi:uncharacterized protein (DUF1499 family)
MPSIWIRFAQALGQGRDLGPTDFARIVRRRSGNDALIAPRDMVPDARIDAEPPEFTLAAPELLRRIIAVALAEPRTVRLDAGEDPHAARFEQRSAVFRFPDIVDVRVLSRGAARATAALHSRSVVGRRDFGVNRARLARWLQALRERT